MRENCCVCQAARLCTLRQAKIQLLIVLVLVLAFTAPRFAEHTLVSTTANGSALQSVYVANATRLRQNETYVLINHSILYTAVLVGIPLAILSALSVRLIR